MALAAQGKFAESLQTMMEVISKMGQRNNKMAAEVKELQTIYKNKEAVKNDRDEQHLAQ